MDHNDLFKEFPPVSTEAWEEKINKDLKGADYERKLIWKTDEGFRIKPYYRNEDLKAIDYLDNLPGDFPFNRSKQKKGNEWLIRQNVKVGDIKETNQKVLDLLMKGVDSIGFILKEDHKYTYEEIDLLFKNIFAENIESNFCCGNSSLNILEIILQLVKNYNRKLDKITGSVDYDPLGNFSLHGKFPVSDKVSFDQCTNLIHTASHLPNFRVLTMHGEYFRNSGGGIIEELAFSLSMAVEYLTQITERGLSINDIAPRIKFNFAVGPNYFMEIAKLRAARLLWANIVKAYGKSSDETAKMHIHTITSDWNKTVYDPHVNLLRTTTESMSSIIGGTDSLTVKPFDQTYVQANEFSERIARNQQLLLKEESYLDKVADPAAGSYFIENLTDSIVGEAWKLFLEVEENGGYLHAFRQGFVQSKIKATAEMRDMAIAQRKVNLLGTNQYPNFNEHIDAEMSEKVFMPKDLTVDDAEVETLKPYRGAQAFERLRYQTDQYALKNRRPKVFMLTFGNMTMRRARAQFACNFFACAGFEVIDNIGFGSVAEGVEAAHQVQADIVVLCSSDDEYLDIASEACPSLTNKAKIVVAGYPKGLIEELEVMGVEGFVHARSNVLEELKSYQRAVDVNRKNKL